VMPAIRFACYRSYRKNRPGRKFVFHEKECAQPVYW
jgi:hypothetical protein